MKVDCDNVDAGLVKSRKKSISKRGKINAKQKTKKKKTNPEHYLEHHKLFCGQLKIS
jgi:23S rRNA maturation mini-RNase III